jgi:hypothetical protein
MKLSPNKSSAKKTMRVATVITGVAACATAFTPTLPAEAAPNLPASNNGAPNSPYNMSVLISGKVSTIQACGYKNVGGGEWECTGIIPRNSPELTAQVLGTNWRQVQLGDNWRRGLVKLWWNKHGAGSWDECNTNGTFNGQLDWGVTNGSYSVLLTNGVYNSKGGFNQGPIGFGVAEC